MYTTRIYWKYSPTAFSYFSVCRYGIKLHASHGGRERRKRESSIIKNIVVYYEWTSRDNVTCRIWRYMREYCSVEISNTWNRANHFYCRELFHLTFFSKRVYLRRGNSWISLSSPIKFSMFFATDYASKIYRRNIFNGWLRPLRSLRAFHSNFYEMVSLPHFCRRRDNFAIICSYFDSIDKCDAKHAINFFTILEYVEKFMEIYVFLSCLENWLSVLWYI